jgi:hypothetical protein
MLMLKTIEAKWYRQGANHIQKRICTMINAISKRSHQYATQKANLETNPAKSPHPQRNFAHQGRARSQERPAPKIEV